MAQEPLERNPDVLAAEAALDEVRSRAGIEYLKALRSLGLDPDILCWVYEPGEGEMGLALITTLAERVESMRIYDLLFRAYEAAATPREVDPFIVSVYGSGSVFATWLKGILARYTANGMPLAGDTKKGTKFSFRHQSINLWDHSLGGDRIVLARGVYALKQARRSHATDLKRWKTFERNVLRLAA